MEQQFAIGQIVTAQLGNPGDAGYSEDNNENVPCKVIAFRKGMGGPTYLIQREDTNEVCLATMPPRWVESELYSTASLSFARGTAFETVEAIASYWGFKDVLVTC